MHDAMAVHKSRSNLHGTFLATKSTYQKNVYIIVRIRLVYYC